MCSRYVAPERVGHISKNYCRVPGNNTDFLLISRIPMCADLLISSSIAWSTVVFHVIYAS